MVMMERFSFQKTNYKLTNQNDRPKEDFLMQADVSFAISVEKLIRIWWFPFMYEG